MKSTSKSSRVIGTLFEFSSGRESRIPRHQIDLRFDMLIGDEEVHGCQIDRLVEGEVPFRIISEDVISVLNGMPGKAPAETSPSHTE